MALKAALCGLFFVLSLPDSPKACSVSISPSGEIKENKSVTLTCSSNSYPAPEYTWYKTKSQGHHSKGSELVFSSIQSSDSGRYYCEAVSKLGRKTCGYKYISVKYAPKPPSVSVSPSGEIVEGKPMLLTCRSDANPVVEYTWYKKNRNPGHQPLNTITQPFFGSVKASDSGEYYCAVENKLGSRKSESIFIDVKYAPKINHVSVNLSRDVVEGTTVALTCNSDANPAANYTWYKKNEHLGRQYIRRGPQLVVVSIQSSDSGEFICEAENKLGRTHKPIVIDVKYAPKLPSVSVSPPGEIVEGSSVTLTCSSDANPAANYTWFKKNENPDLQLLGEGPKLSFKSIQSSDLGQYHCEAENELGRRSEHVFVNVKYAPKLPSVLINPSGEIMEGSSVTLTCSSDANPAANYTWYKKNEHLGHRYIRRGPQLVVVSIQSSDSGEFICEAENKLGRTHKPIVIDVKYAPKLPSVSVSPPGEIVEGSSVTLTCSSDANPAANYTLYKKNENPDLQLLGKGPQLSFKSIQSSDLGQYHCEAENELGRRSEHVFVNVKYAPKLPSVSVSPSGEIMEGSSVTLTCSSDANPAANYTWYKKDEDSPKASGENFTIDNTRPEHSGDYVCVAHNEIGHHNFTVHVTVMEGPWKLITATTVPAILFNLILIFVIIWIIKKKRTCKQQSEPGERPDNSEQCSQIHLEEQQNDPLYATIHFSKNQEECVHPSIKLFELKRNKKTQSEEEDKVKEEMVEYSAVRFYRPNAFQN